MSRPAVSLLVLFGAPLVLLWAVPHTALLGFAGLLVAIAARGAARTVGRRLRLPVPASLALVVAVALGGAAAAVAAVAPALGVQADELLRRLPEAWDTLHRALDDTSWGRALLEELGPGTLIAGVGPGAANIATAAVARTTGWLTNALYLFFLSLFLAAAPATHVAGLRALVAPELRPWCDVVLPAIADALRAWMGAQLLAAAIVGGLTFAGLVLLGMPVPGILAALAALLGLVPVLGPILAAVPALLLAFAVDRSLVAWVGGLYLLVQVVEGNLITPVVQSRVIRLPPSLILLAQLVMLALFGLLGLALAAPLAAVLLVLVQRLYVGAFLERRPPPGIAGDPRQG